MAFWPRPLFPDTIAPIGVKTGPIDSLCCRSVTCRDGRDRLAILPWGSAGDFRQPLAEVSLVSLIGRDEL